MTIRKTLSPLFLYSAIFALIITWWSLAFRDSLRPISLTHQKTLSFRNKSPSLLASLSPLKRNMLHSALSGDKALMAKMIADWDVDAQLLSVAGHSTVKRLPRHMFLRSQVLGRQLTAGSSDDRTELNRCAHVEHVVDDIGTEIRLSHAIDRFIPQTYASASFLLALADAKQIIALPQGLRSQTALFPKQLTDKIPLDIDRYNSETLFLAHPHTAFVASYSHPALVNALQDQGVQLFTLTNLDSVSDIQKALIRIGHTINRSMEAELLSLFMESAMLALDNRILALKDALVDHALPRTLFVNYHTQFTIPTKLTMTGHLLERLGVAQPSFATSRHEWTIPIDHEQIANFNPFCMIIAAGERKALGSELNNWPALAHVSAVQEGRVVFVDDAIQQFPSQYVVLAYYDLFSAIAQACLL